MTTLREYWQHERALALPVPRRPGSGAVGLEVVACVLALLVSAVPLIDPPPLLRLIVLAPAIVAFLAAWNVHRGRSRRWLTAAACMAWLVALLLLPLFLFGLLFVPSALAASVAACVGRQRRRR